MNRISTVIITFNEESNIERCLESVAPFSDEIIVVDSHSTDRTVELARAYTSRIFAHDWLGYGKQKQLALSKASGDWVLAIDADEEVSPALREELGQLDFRHDGYFVLRKVWYLNRWITHGGWYPGLVLRLFKREGAFYTDKIIHESVVVRGSTGILTSPLHHYSYRDISHHLEKINQFTTLSARQMHHSGKRAKLLKLLLSPPLEFLKVYLLKRGFLDGSAGLTIAILHSYYVFLKQAKLREMGENASGEAGRKDHISESAISG